MRVAGIYKIINRLNGKYYVGSSINVQGSRGRLVAHRCSLRYNYHCNEHLQRAWNLYGEAAFEFVLVEEVQSPTELKQLEQKYLDIAKQSPSQTYNAIFDAFNKNPSPATRLKRSLALKGRKVSEATKRKISRSHLGKKHTKEHIANFIKTKTGLKWGKHTEETKKKMSLAQTGEKGSRYDFTKHNWVNQKTNQVFHGTQYEFSNAFNLDKGGVNLVLKGRRNSLYGWKVICV